ncbi:MAG: hypothetical protein MHMPM18_000075 [Marteilia pararefringens]
MGVFRRHKTANAPWKAIRLSFAASRPDELKQNVAGSQLHFLRSQNSMFNYSGVNEPQKPTAAAAAADLCKNAKSTTHDGKYNNSARGRAWATSRGKSVKHAYINRLFGTFGTEHMRDEVRNKREPPADHHHEELGQSFCSLGVANQQARSIQESFNSCCENSQNVSRESIRSIATLFTSNTTRLARKAGHFECLSQMAEFVLPINFYKEPQARHVCMNYDFAARRSRLKECRLVTIAREVAWCNSRFGKMNLKMEQLPFIENFQSNRSEEMQEHRIDSLQLPHKTLLKGTENLNNLNKTLFDKSKDDIRILRARILYDVYKLGNSELIAIIKGDANGIRRGVGNITASQGRAKSEGMLSAISTDQNMKPVSDDDQATIVVLSRHLLFYILNGAHIGVILVFRRKTRVQIFPDCYGRPN